MVQASLEGDVKSIEEGIERGMAFCAQKLVADSVLGLYPAAIIARDPDGEIGFKGRSTVFNGMDEGLCQLGIVYQQDFQRAQSEGCEPRVEDDSNQTNPNTKSRRLSPPSCHIHVHAHAMLMYMILYMCMSHVTCHVLLSLLYMRACPCTCSPDNATAQ